LDTASLIDSLHRANQTWFLPGILGRRRVSKALHSALKPGARLSGDQLEAELTQLQRLHEEEAVLSSASDRAREVFGGLWLDGNANWDELTSASRWTNNVRKQATAIAGKDTARLGALRDHWAQIMTEYREQLGPDGAFGQQLGAFCEAGNAVMAAWQSLSQLLLIDQTALVDYQDAPGCFAAILARVACWEGGLDNLHDWCVWIRMRTQAVEARLLPLVAPYEQGKLTHANFEPAFVRGLYQAWAEQEIAKDPALSSFARGLFENKIQQFRELDRTFAQLTRDEVRARLAARVPRALGDPAQNSEMGILGRELRRKNHMALRSLFQKIPNVLSRLKPCLLMSPISVAQYLDPSHTSFDLVIFDEASQVPTCEAVGAIARGKEAFIVGDPKQLPPTSFFTTINPEDDDESMAIPDLESILDDCLAIRMPEEHLVWHYRSQHESLIAFSNCQYYDNRLLTFPSPNDLTPKVHWRPVEGVYDRGKTKQNRAEADAIVAEVFRRLRDPELCQLSIGVVTFSSVQQKLIEDLLDEHLLLEQDLERFFTADAIEPVFVKNLENVQGDERDVILFSIGYGPDAQGRVSMNFGPLNKEGGWRRLNVAVSRARQEMLVFSTLRADQLDSTRTSAKGVADLKAFLEYAERGKQALFSQRPAKADSGPDLLFEEQVCHDIRARGHDVDVQVGCSGYRLDLAVVDPDHPGQYLLGIECDGAMYNQARTARDRDKLREAVLRQLGWQIHRVWSTDWWENPKREIDRIEEAIAAARQQTAGAVLPRSTVPDANVPQQSLTIANAVIPSSSLQLESMATAAVPYSTCELPRVSLGPDQFYLPTTTRTIAAQIAQVTNEEGPISYGLLCRRIISAWGMPKMSSRIEARIREVGAALKLRTTMCGASIFYWPEAVDPAQYESFRIPSEGKQTRRDAEDIPPEESANAALEVLRQQISLPEDDLVREVARLFGFQRSGSALDQNLRMGIAQLLGRGAASFDGQGRVVHVE
ncbi:MAG: DUF3320 domain-containing protein, partial [Dehalococcoidia bacterium]|nr:DUF3320 domain-containing protein [Dehalococcoidia bacterium]